MTQEHDPINVRDGYPVIVELQGRKTLSVGKNWLKVNKYNLIDDYEALFFKAYFERYGSTHISTMEQELKNSR